MSNNRRVIWILCTAKVLAAVGVHGFVLLRALEANLNFSRFSLRSITSHSVKQTKNGSFHPQRRRMLPVKMDFNEL